jgi:hypothetical protein
VEACFLLLMMGHVRWPIKSPNDVCALPFSVSVRDYLRQLIGCPNPSADDPALKTFSSVSDFQIPKCFAFLLFSLASLQLFHLQVSPQAFISNTDSTKNIESQHTKHL